MADYRDRRKEEERVKAVRNDRALLMNERADRFRLGRKKNYKRSRDPEYWLVHWWSFSYSPVLAICIFAGIEVRGEGVGADRWF